MSREARTRGRNHPAKSTQGKRPLRFPYGLLTILDLIGSERHKARLPRRKAVS